LVHFGTINRGERLASAAISDVAVDYAAGRCKWKVALAQIAHVIVQHGIPHDRRRFVLSHALHGHMDSGERHSARVADLLTAVGADAALSRSIRRELCDSRH
jgi:hypothetical protein